ncbi:MAG: hypothetical protein JSU58_03155 [Dehalococcoidales bacterium]|nr:MAG: hypothetical protein JSU58_03155 [Dehalococcoidales bacterium]
MLRNNQEYNSYILSTIHSMWENPGGIKHIIETERHLATRNKGKSGKGPHRNPRDFSILFFTTIFTILFCIVGAFIGNMLGDGRGIVLGIIVGILVGIFIGPRLVVYINKIRDKRWQRSVKKQDKYKENNQGPIIR